MVITVEKVVVVDVVDVVVVVSGGLCDKSL